MPEPVGNPLPGLVLTLGVWGMALFVRSRLRTPLANPVALSVAAIILLLLATNTSYEAYNVGGRYISFLLGPAVVAMAVPLYRQRILVRRHALPLLGGVVAGAICGILSAALIARVLGASAATVASLAPKSVTTPIAMALAEETGGIPSLTAAAVILTGMLGAMAGPEILRFLGVRGSLALGLAVGTAAHGIGTARAFEEGELTGTLSGIGMTLNGAVTAVLLPYVLPLCLPGA